MKYDVLAFFVVLSGCYDSGKHGQDGWGDEDAGEPAHDIVHDEHDTRPDFSLDNPSCGNGIVDPGEECDDGNLTNNDACMNSCMAAMCGDGYLWLGVEACDDSNTIGGDGCSADCRSNETCGNGYVDVILGEECDDGADNSDTEPDACRTDCSPARCGDGVADTGEECDGFLNLGGRTCLSQGHVGGGILTCGASCRFDTSGCRDPECGDAICGLGETETGCPADCSSGCGNGSCEDVEDQFGCPTDCGAVGISVSAHSCALLADRTVRCWGGAYGAAPVAVVGLTDVLSVEAPPEGSSSMCAVLEDGTVVCWEDGVGGVPTTVAGLSDVLSFRRAIHHGCAVVVGGTVQCWGSNPTGQLGNGTSDFMGETYDPGTVSGMTNAVSVGTGGWWYHGHSWGHSCALRVDGTIHCWGANQYGQLGSTTTESDSCIIIDGAVFSLYCSRVPIEVRDIVGAVAVAANINNTCAILGDGTARCWGDNIYGQLGNWTDTTSSNVPVTVLGLTGVVLISAGGHHACALLSDGTARCWGSNWDGELGDGTRTGSNVPVTVTGLAGGVAISAGMGHTCAVISDGTAWCWGSNGSGQLGDGTNTDSSVPVQVAAW